MSQAKKVITLAVRGTDGTKRVQLALTDNSKSLYEKVKAAFDYTSFNFSLSMDRANTKQIMANSNSMSEFKLKHGDMIYLKPLPGANLTTTSKDNEDVPSPMDTTGLTATGAGAHPLRPSTSTSSIRSNHSNTSLQQRRDGGPVVEEDEVDLKLRTQDGLIRRPKDSMCRHGDTGCCLHCAPLEPYDEGYLKENNIKHISFHSYLRKLTNGVDKGKFAALEDLDIRIKEGCTTHPPWPNGICSRCQPSAITLNRQSYRHVDNVLFENPEIVDRFLSYWRSTGFQRLGFLYGTYEQHKDVPLGIRARVAAIYEPPQESGLNSVTFNPDEKLEAVNEIVAKGLGLKCIGWIFTDLMPEDISKGTVRNLRNIESHFLSAQECATMAYFQNKHPNPCKINKNGVFGSKFATVLVTGDETNQVHMVGYQVSNQCMALVRENCFLPTKDVAGLGYIKESSAEQYVPDVFYKEKNEYGYEEQKVGRPLPVEYLMVDVPVATPIEPLYSFPSRPGIVPFPIENRLIDGHIQDFSALATYLSQFRTGTPFLEIASDFHFLLFIATTDIVTLTDYIGPLLEAIKDKDKQKAMDWARSDHWGTIEQLISASNMAGNQLSDSGLGGVGSPHDPASHNSNAHPMISPQETWVCAHCTFLNSGSRPACEVCTLPRIQ